MISFKLKAFFQTLSPFAEALPFDDFSLSAVFLSLQFYLLKMLRKLD